MLSINENITMVLYMSIPLIQSRGPFIFIYQSINFDNYVVMVSLWVEK